MDIQIQEYQKVLDIPVGETGIEWWKKNWREFYHESDPRAQRYYAGEDEPSDAELEPELAKKKEAQLYNKPYISSLDSLVQQRPVGTMYKHRKLLKRIAKHGLPKNLICLQNEGSSIILIQEEITIICGYLRALFLFLADEIERKGGINEAAMQMIGNIGTRHVKSLHLLPSCFHMLFTFAKITPKNQNILLAGVKTWIHAQEEEIGDVNFEDTYTPFVTDSAKFYANSFVLSFYDMCKKLLKNTKETHFLPPTDIYPKAPGKDDTNEIEFAANPLNDDTKELDSSAKENALMLDSMRNRHAKFLAGGSEYDYCYKELGFDVKLTKAKEIDITRTLAHQAIVTQIIKSNVLLLCSSFFYKEYEVKSGWEDHLIVGNHIVTDMKEEEINKSIQIYNSYSMQKSVKSNLKRYENGYYPQIQKPVLLEYMNESVGRLYEIYTHLYPQLDANGKKKFSFIQQEKDDHCTQIREILYTLPSLYAYHVDIHGEDYYLDYKQYYSNYVHNTPQKIPLKELDLPAHFTRLQQEPFTFNSYTQARKAQEEYFKTRVNAPSFNGSVEHELKQFNGKFARFVRNRECKALGYTQAPFSLEDAEVTFLPQNNTFSPIFNEKRDTNKPCKVYTRTYVFRFFSVFTKSDISEEIERIKKYLKQTLESFEEPPKDKSENNLDTLLQNNIL